MELTTSSHSPPAERSEPAEALEAETAPATAAPDGALNADADALISRAVRDGDLRAAVAAAARTHGVALGRLCQALVGGAGDAEDLVQETLLAAHDALPSFRGECSLRGFLLGIARRKCAAHLAKRGRRELPASSSELASAGAALAPSADELLATRERAVRARALLDELKPAEREALVLRFVGELSFRDVGAALAIDEQAARKRVSRALAQLRTRAAEAGEGSRT